MTFTSDAPNLVSNDSNAAWDVFIRSYDDDADGFRDNEDNCPTFPTAWWVPTGDGDCGGFPDTLNSTGRGNEGFIATDPTDRCPDNSTDDAWPPDTNNSGAANLSDVILFGPHFNKKAPDPGYSSRFDLNASNNMNLSDVLVVGPFYNKTCTP